MRLKELTQRISLKWKGAFPDDLEAYLDQFIPNTLLKSETLQQAFDVSNYEMEEIYAEAYTFYQEDSFVDSSTSFRWLALLNPFRAKYWMGLAASLQLLQKQEKALHAYAVAALLDSENPYPHFYAFECFLSLSNRDEAKKALDNAYKLAIGKDAHRDLKENIENLELGFSSS